MISGADKAHAVHEVIEGEKNPDRFPAQQIIARQGELHFFMDEAAAAQLKTSTVS
jgi:6-phosphogluconolactonase